MTATDWASYGEVFTKRWVVETILDAVGYTPNRDLTSLLLCEPSCGSGAFLGPAVERLLVSATRHGVPIGSLGGAIRAYDLQDRSVEASRTLCADLLAAAGLGRTQAAAIAQEWVNPADFLLDPLDVAEADFVVGNPPYIRYDDLPARVASAYRRAWPTMKGRGDIYIGFIERGLGMLAPGGRLGYICADRWMRNQYGASLRSFVADGYAVEQVWSMHDVDAFEAKVSAYPAVTVLARAQQGQAVVADTTAAFGPEGATALSHWAAAQESDRFSSDGVEAHRLPHWFPGSESWPTGSPARLALIEKLAETMAPLHDPQTGTKVSIGIATGADRVYVTKDPEAVEADRMLPLAMRRDLMGGAFDWQGNYLVNPWDSDGRLVDLADYPKMASYLAGHPTIKERHVARRDPRSWHRTIDKVAPGVAERPKILLQDMKAHIHPVLEPGGHYPHHNLYFVTSDTWDLEVLGGLLLSRIAQAFIEAYCVRMRGGTLRFQAQYLRKIRVPAPDAVSAEDAEALRRAFKDRDVTAATAAAGRVYGIDLARYELDEDRQRGA